MTRTTKWFTVPALSIGALGIAFSAGIFVDHTAVAQAQYVPRPEYTKDQNDLHLRQLRDSLTQVAQHTEEVVRLDRIERVLYKMACKQFPTECDR